MIRTLLFTTTLAIAGAAVAQDPHAGHNMHAAVIAPQSGVTTVPADGAMTHGSPEQFSATFPHAMVLKTLTLTTPGQESLVLTAPEAPPAPTVTVALPRLAPATYSAAWTAEGADGHKMTGSLSFMVH